MTDSPIKLRADVSPTCRGSTGTRHNGWNPAPLVPSSCFALEIASPELETSRADNHGWNPDSSVRPTSLRTCGVAHAIHRCFVPRSRPPRPRWRLRHRSARGFQRPSYPLLTRPAGTLRRLRGGLWRLGRLGILASAAACSIRTAGDRSVSGSPRSGSHVRSGLEGRFAAGGRSVAGASGLGALGRSGLVLLGCRGCGASAFFAGGRPCRLPGRDSAAGCGSSAGGGPHGLRSIRSGIHGALDLAGRGSFRDFAIVRSRSNGGFAS
jgi:hypothetical protein